MSKKPRGNIHKIREFELEKIQLVDEFDILQIVGEGWFGKILLVEHRASQTEMVLKAVPKPYVSLRDFYREFHYGLHLGIHRNIVTTYDVAFETAGFYVFTQEYAPLGDLTSNVTETGVGEVYSKRVAKQIASALDYMHSKDIVHRDVKLDNVLIYRSDFSRIKLCDFGESYQAGTLVERRNEWLPYSPPEVLEVKPESTYKADPNHDVWQFGIVVFVCLTGCLPWQKAASDDPRYMRYLGWQASLMLPIRRTPKLFKLLSSRAQRMFRRFLEPRGERRPKDLSDLVKFLDDRWLAKTAEKEMAEYETDELCPSMYSFHSSPDEKNRLLYTLADCGIETNVDRQTKKNRIKDWIEASVITEEDEEEAEEGNSASPSSSVSREPVPGHISSLRAADKAKEIKTTLKDATQKHFDPRTGALQQGPSEMGASLYAQSQSNISMLNNGNDSLAGSLLTLGSRQDPLGSRMQMFTSDMELSHLGESPYGSSRGGGSGGGGGGGGGGVGGYDRQQQRYINQSLSSSNLLINEDQQTHPAMLLHQQQQQHLLNPNTAFDRRQKPVHRSKSDSLRKALFASTPTIDAAHSGLQNNNKQNSVTVTGLANAFKSLAHISLPAAGHLISQSGTPPPPPSSQQQQLAGINGHPQQQPYFNRQHNDSQVKDSAYGSEMSGSTTRIAHTTTGKDSSLHQSNGYINQSITYQQQQQQQHTRTVSTVRTQSSQQQRIYTGAPPDTTNNNNSNNYRGSMNNMNMKDTAYDRRAMTNSNNSRNRR